MGLATDHSSVPDMLLEAGKLWKPFGLPPGQETFCKGLCRGGSLCCSQGLSCLMHLQLRTLTRVLITVKKKVFMEHLPFCICSWA